MLANRAIDPDWIIMLEEIIIPSTLLDQPDVNSPPVQDGIGITQINGIISKESLATLTELYAFNNRRKKLPLDIIIVVIYEGA